MLALAAARLGHAPVLACDDDPLAVAASRENAARNGLAIQVWQTDALYDELPKAVAAVAREPPARAAAGARLAA